MRWRPARSLWSSASPARAASARTATPTSSAVTSTSTRWRPQRPQRPPPVRLDPTTWPTYAKRSRPYAATSTTCAASSASRAKRAFPCILAVDNGLWGLYPPPERAFSGRRDRFQSTPDPPPSRYGHEPWLGCRLWVRRRTHAADDVGTAAPVTNACLTIAGVAVSEGARRTGPGVNRRRGHDSLPASAVV